jgi:hypothetical protein
LSRTIQYLPAYQLKVGNWQELNNAALTDYDVYMFISGMG